MRCICNSILQVCNNYAYNFLEREHFSRTVLCYDFFAISLGLFTSVLSEFFSIRGPNYLNCFLPITRLLYIGLTYSRHSFGKNIQSNTFMLELGLKVR